MEERRDVANAFLQRWASFADCLEACFLDSLENRLTTKYGLWPERHLLVRDGTVAWASTFEDTHGSVVSRNLRENAQELFAGAAPP